MEGRTEDLVLDRLIKAINKEGFSVVRMDALVEDKTHFTALKTPEGIRKTGYISLLIQAESY